MSTELQLAAEILLPAKCPDESSYPCLFGSIGIFEPTTERSRADTKGWNPDIDADVYQAGMYSIKRFGPGLSIYDEDTLIATLQLAREREMTGNLCQLQNSLSRHNVPATEVAFEGDSIRIYFGCLTLTTINNFLGRGVGGEELKLTAESIDRLANTTLWLYDNRRKVKTNLKFFRVCRSENPRAPMKVILDPEMVLLLSDYIILNLTIRGRLSDVGKAVHRYISVNRSDIYDLKELAQTIRFSQGISELKRALLGRNGTKGEKARKGQLEILKECGWLRSYEVSGTGKARPFKLHIERSDRP